MLALEMEEGGQENGGRNQGMQVASRSWKRQGNGFSSGAFTVEYSPANALILAWRDQCWTSDLQNSKPIILYCLSH